MSGRAASTSGLIEGQGRGEDRAAASYHRRTNSGDGSTIDRPARGQGESFTYSRFVEESRAADDVAEMTKFASFGAGPTAAPSPLLPRKFNLGSSVLATTKKFKKVLVANRGEIAIRIYRACNELGIKSVGIFAAEDAFSLHRFKADEAFLVGEGKSPLRAYLDIASIIQICLENDVDAIHPGYGFLSENADCIAACNEAGIVFIGPTEKTVRALGDKVAARNIAIAANVPVIPGTSGTDYVDVAKAKAFCEEHGFPVLLKAAFGGGGRGMRVVRAMDEVEDAFVSASREAENAFGNGTMFVERYLQDPRHIEVQLLGDKEGNVIHIAERDCSVQRRHQKVVEMAPCPTISEKVRQTLFDDAIKIAKHVGYENAGTAEFLVEQSGKHFFIEVNPRIQVEHTCSEQITNIDIVKAQICVAMGASLAELDLTQDKVKVSGIAIQVRITTEDPKAGFKPSTGRLQVYRMPGGPGIRLDSAVATGSVITPHFDSLMAKMIVTARTYEDAIARLLRALAEIRIRGVTTNVPFIRKVLTHETFLSGDCRTTFIDNTPELFDFSSTADPTTGLLMYLSDMVVNGTAADAGKLIPAANSRPALPAIPEHMKGLTPSGWMDVLRADGAAGFAKAVRANKGALITDTTMRDAHQSLLATRVRSVDLKAIAPYTSAVLGACFSLECWGGATFDTCLRFLHEDPWKRLRELRKLVPNIPLQMLLRGSNAVGYTAYPDNVVVKFIHLAKKNGVDIFRVFDSLNYVPNLEVAIKAIKECGGVAEAVVCYTGDVLDQECKFSTAYYIGKVEQLLALGIHVLAIKDMAGLLKPQAARLLISTLREKFPDLPIHVHTHDTAGTGVATYLACLESGADVVDCCTDSMSGLTSQPSIGALVGALAGTPLDSGLKQKELRPINEYWETARTLYAPFESPGLRSGNSDVYNHEMPGGQYTNLQFQANSLGLQGRWPAIKQAYADANKLCGSIVKVTPSSKMIGDFAQFMISNDLTPEQVRANAATLDFPESVVKFFQGYLGQPDGGFPEQLRKDVVRDRPMITERPGASIPPMDLDKLLEDLKAKRPELELTETDAMSAALYPKVFDDYMAFKSTYGDLSWVPTFEFFQAMEVGQTLDIPFQKEKEFNVRLLATGRLLPNQNREVFWEVNGSARMIEMYDKTADADVTSGASRKKADPAVPGSVGASMSGVVVETLVVEGQDVKAGEQLVILSAMKMETIVCSPVDGKVASLHVKALQSIDQGDLLVTVE